MLEIMLKTDAYTGILVFEPPNIPEIDHLGSKNAELTTHPVPAKERNDNFDIL